MNNPKDMLVSKPLSSEWIAYVISTRTEEGAINVISMAAAKLRSERDELVDMLYEAAGYADEVTDSEGADDFAKRARKVLAKHKPE